MSRWDLVSIERTIVAAVEQHAKTSPAAVADGDDVFAAYGLNSLETFRVLVKLEKEFDVDIGAEPSEFERARTLGGLKAMVLEKVAGELATEAP